MLAIQQVSKRNSAVDVTVLLVRISEYLLDAVFKTYNERKIYLRRKRNCKSYYF